MHLENLSWNIYFQLLAQDLRDWEEWATDEKCNG